MGGGGGWQDRGDITPVFKFDFKKNVTHCDLHLAAFSVSSEGDGYSSNLSHVFGGWAATHDDPVSDVHQ